MNDDAALASSLFGTPQATNQTHSISVAVDPVSLVVTECITVTSAMRKHARWAHSSVSAILGGGSSNNINKETPINSRRDGKSRDAVGSVHFGGKDGDGEALASRWGLRGKKGKSMQDNPLMSAFARLRNDLKGCKDIHSVETPALLHPFLQVIRSSSTSAPITSLALIAITKFLAYDIISRESPKLALGMQLLSSAITHCRFEATDSAADEIVLLRILKLMEGMISGPGGDILSDESVCEMMETGLSMCCQVRLSEVLRRSAEISMVTMCQTIFQRLKTLEVEAGETLGGLEATTKGDMDAVKMDPSVNGENAIASPGKQKQEPQTPNGQGPELDTPKDDIEGRSSTSATLNGSTVELPHLPDAEEAPEIKPYSLPSIRELFRVLVDLLDPHDRQHTDTMRVMALRIVDVALEVAGPSIANHPSLASLAKDTLCRHLFQLVRSENMAILNESLRVAGTLLSTCRSVLKLQQELYLSYLVACLHPRIEIPQEPGINPSLYEGVPQAPRLGKPSTPQPTSSGRSTPVPVKDRQKLGLEGGNRKPDAREAMVENVGHLVRIPSFMVELFVNYDCEIDRSDVCMDMVGLLSRSAFPDSATWSTTNVPPLCLDALLGYVQFIADRLEDDPVHEGYPDRAKLREQRSQKKVIIRGATKFNENPKGGIAFLAYQGIIDDPNNPRSVVKFLKGTTRIDKTVLGDYLSKKSNEGLLGAFLDLFDFTGLRVDEALRLLLNSFRLPGESQLIERIVTVFAEKYCASDTPEGIKNNDAVYVLTYAIIMLNTDQHNPNLKAQNRMSYNDFARNLRGVNNGQDFPPDYLQEIYDSIRTREIILPEEHDNKHAYDHAWKELLIKAQDASDLVVCNTNVFDADMFSATWKPVVATLTYVFLSASDDAVFSRVVTGFDQCAQIAAKYGLSDALDHIIYCLSSVSTLASEVPPSTNLNTEVQAEDENGKRSVMVSETAVRFGRDFKAQLATVVLFKVVTGHESTVRDGWVHLVRIMLNLFLNSLVPASYASTDDRIALAPIPLQNPAQIIERSERSNESGIFSAFTSYVSSFANDEPPEPSDQEIEYTLNTVDCVKACDLHTIFSNIKEMPLMSLKSLIASLIAQIPESSSPRVIVVKPDIPAPSPLRPNGTRVQSKKPVYDPCLVYILELATILALRDAETVEHLGQQVASALQSVIRDAAHVHSIVLSRAVHYLLLLLRASNDHDYIRAPVVLHTISSFDEELLKQSALPVLKGMFVCIQGPSGLRKEMATSPDFWVILHRLHRETEATPVVFDILEDVGTGSPSAITSDNYESAISLLNDFATAGSVGATQEQKRDEALKRGRQQKDKPKQSEVVIRAVKAMARVHQMTDRVPTFISQSQLDREKAWPAYWTPIFRALTTQSLNPCRSIRHQALTSLQRALLSPALTHPAPSPNSNKTTPSSSSTTAVPTSNGESDYIWTTLFSTVLFPLITQLLRPEIYQSDPVGMSETRVQAATLLCKIFLHYLAQLASWEGMLDLWTHILSVLDRLMHSGAGGGSAGGPAGAASSSLTDTLEEAIPESLKNILLVMADGGYLVPPPTPAPPPSATSPAPDPQAKNDDARTPQQQQLWAETWLRLDRFLPGLMPELFPEAAKRPPVALKVRSGVEGSASEVVRSPVRDVDVASPVKKEDQGRGEGKKEGVSEIGEGGNGQGVRMEDAKVEDAKA
ncbi:MAG: GDP/GTP exchange factor for ARF [Bathelium mastoideum]|nr:MAG: GDP/GTP exchange factor for ARF [Bathelium mastoideum]